MTDIAAECMHGVDYTDCARCKSEADAKYASGISAILVHQANVDVTRVVSANELTVGDLRRALEGVPDDAAVELEVRFMDDHGKYVRIVQEKAVALHTDDRDFARLVTEAEP